ncbi:hypothetical protein [Stenotrophomonas sp.]|jgi:hypothetical protein|uniref:hypothetical protein n=2 Tax=Stenotrophomonas TaxID=40323 RepID=UPI002899FE7D|nr:hypothetical protein [Stenotrophomonas sp.]
MSYLIVLDPQSVTARCYASKGPDGTWFGQPCLICVQMDASHPLYLAAEREISHAGTRQRQRLHIPHEAVAFVIEGPMGQGRQLGFRAISS